MRRLLVLLALAALFVSPSLRAQQPFTLQQILSAPYALSLTAAPVGDQFAWVENAEGVRNLWVAGAKGPARQLTHYTEDDGQDIAGLAWSPDGTSIAYTYGAESGASGKPRESGRDAWAAAACDHAAACGGRGGVGHWRGACAAIHAWRGAACSFCGAARFGRGGFGRGRRCRPL